MTAEQHDTGHPVPEPSPEGWTTAGENVESPAADVAADNQPGVPGWLWMMVAGAILAALASCGLIGLTITFVGDETLSAVLGCVGAGLALVALLLTLRAIPLLLVAANQMINQRRQR